MRKFVGAAGPSITLVAALVMLIASVVALFLANSLRGQLEEAQGQLQDTQSELQTAQDRQQKAGKAGAGPTVREPGTVNKTQPQDNTPGRVQEPKSSTPEGQDQQPAIPAETPSDGGSWLPYPLLLSLGLVVLASSVLIVTSVRALVTRGSRPGKSGAAGSGAPSRTETSNLERESPSEEGSWIGLVEECVGVVDELDEHMGSFDTPRQEVAGHVVLRLEEILVRSGVDIISNDAVFDRARHKPDGGHAATGNGAAVRETLSPGFAVGARVLRRARVRLE